MDAATGYAVSPVAISVGSAGTRFLPELTAQAMPIAPGRVLLFLEPGPQEVTVFSDQHRTFSTVLHPDASRGQRIQFHLEPLLPPPELVPERVATLRRPDAGTVLGFVVDDQTGEPLTGVEVSHGGALRSSTDTRGFFVLHVPATGERLMGLVLRRSEYQTEVRENVLIWPGGDTVVHVRLKRGTGTNFMSEPHRLLVPLPDSLQGPANALDLPPGPTIPPTESAPELGAASTATVRSPRTVRVLLADGVTVHHLTLETYVKRVLPREWIASWGFFTGGRNALMAGAVAVRTYAVGFVNNPLATAYDICGTTQCQVYGTTTHTETDAAVDATQSVLMYRTGEPTIPRHLTEYSAEQNARGLACGDGYAGNAGSCIPDPVCTGETRNGHGRGMCQWGSAKWATGLKFPGNSTANTSATTGQPRRDWQWILDHYYPGLLRVQALPLQVGDAVRVIWGPLMVRSCPDGGISGGIDCAPLGSRPLGSTGTLVGGPVWVTADGRGHTWWKVQWSDGLVGWSAENGLERTTAPPDSSPPVVTAFSVSPLSARLGKSFMISYSVTDSGGSGLQQVELWRAPDAGGAPATWQQLQVRHHSGHGPVTGFFSDTPVSAGWFWYGIHVLDNAGNRNDERNSQTGGRPGVFGPIRVEVTPERDTVPPTVAISHPPHGAVLTTRIVTVTGTASDAGGSGLDMIVVSATPLGSSNWASVSGNHAWWSVTGIELQPGPNLIGARARDREGNLSDLDQVEVLYCPMDLSWALWDAPAEGGQLAFELVTGEGCPWTVAHSCAAWLTVNPMAGRGSATLTVLAAPNCTGQPRACELSIEGQPVSIRQVSLRPPILQATRRASTVELTWPAQASGFHLMSATNLAGPWVPVLQSPRMMGDHFVVDEPLGRGIRFYRLQTP